MTPSHLDNPEFWRNRAEEARALSGQMRDQTAKQALLNIADIYEKLAKNAEEGIKARKSSD